jgi:hypothetical protein
MLNTLAIASSLVKTSGKDFPDVFTPTHKNKAASSGISALFAIATHDFTPRLAERYSAT